MTTEATSVVEASSAPVMQPGALLVFSVDNPEYATIELKPGVPMRWGQGDVGGVRITDRRMSAEHLQVRFQDGQFHLEDLQSTNGSHLNGERFTGRRTATHGDVLRLGRTVLILVRDLTPHRGYVEREERTFKVGETQQTRRFVIGPGMRRILERVAGVRARGRNLVVLGETGTGKELVADHYHRTASRPGPFHALNCANLLAELADAALFGNRRGAFTNAVARNGALTEADGGVLFLDEFAELRMPVQATLLRVIDRGEFTVLGDSMPTRVDVRYVCASHQSMQARVREGQFREDLLYRLNQEQVTLPPLRERLEEIPWLMDLELQRSGAAVRLHAKAVEWALLRSWPGNLRELVSVTASAIGRAVDESEEALQVRHLPEGAGGPLRSAVPTARGPVSTKSAEVLAPAAPPVERPSPERISEALARNAGNISRTARDLGVHRTQLKRDMERHGLLPAKGGPAATVHEDEPADEEDD